MKFKIGDKLRYTECLTDSGSVFDPFITITKIEHHRYFYIGNKTGEEDWFANESVFEKIATTWKERFGGVK